MFSLKGVKIELGAGYFISFIVAILAFGILNFLLTLLLGAGVVTQVILILLSFILIPYAVSRYGFGYYEKDVPSLALAALIVLIIIRIITGIPGTVDGILYSLMGIILSLVVYAGSQFLLFEVLDTE